jgi:general secretion pathway protein K
MRRLRSIRDKVIASREKRRQALETKGLFNTLSNPHGFVLIIVLLICAMLITIAGEFLIGAQNNISYMSNFKEEAQALELARTGITIGAFILDMDKTGKAGSVMTGVNSTASIDTYNDLWAMEMPELPIENGTVKLVIRDEQAKINASILANEFGDSKYNPIAKRLLEQMGFLPDIADSIRDWVDPDSTKSAYGAETFDYYSTLPKPRTAKNRELDSIDELLMVKGITPQIFYGLGGGNTTQERDLVTDNMFIKKMSLDPSSNADSSIDMATIKIGKEKSRALSDYFRAHGSSDSNSPLNKINVNTASFRVLSALTGNIADAKVAELIRTRIEHPFATVDEAAKILGISDDPVKGYLTVSSGLFSMNASGTSHGTTVTIYAVYNRSDKCYCYYGIQ